MNNELFDNLKKINEESTNEDYGIYGAEGKMAWSNFQKAKQMYINGKYKEPLMFLSTDEVPDTMIDWSTFVKLAKEIKI